jgi:hypothetical protein
MWNTVRSAILRRKLFLPGIALIVAAAVLVMGMDRSAPGYASGPGPETEVEAVQTAGGLTTKAIDLPAVQAHCRGQTDQHYGDCVTVNKVLDALAGDCAGCRPLTYLYSTTTGRVVKIKLHKKGLKGHIPAEIGSLEMLEELWLYTNELSGTIPPEMGNLANLTWLFVSDNDLSGQIPETLNNLSLDRLWLHKNNFTGCVPYNLTLTREYKVDTGLAACAAPAGDGTPTPVPTAPAGTPTPAPTVEPTATPTLMPPTPDDLLPRIHCQSADFVAAFGESYDIDDDQTVFPYYDRNGRGLWEILRTVWASSSDPNRIVYCRTTVYDNVSSAGFDNQYAMLVEQVSGLSDVLRQHKRCCEEIGQVYRGLLLRLGYTAVVGANEIVWQETATRLAAVSSFRWNQVIVQVAVYDDSAYYLDSADDMAQRVEARFDDSIFDQIETRQRAAQRGVAGSPLSEDALYLEPPISKP